MPTLYTCSSCLKDFTQRSKYELHLQKKKKCEPSQTVQQLLTQAPVKIETMKSSTGSFRENSLKMNKSISLKDRQDQGIFFTPKKARDLIYEKMDALHVIPTNILEPSFGSGEFLEDLKQKYPNASITGVEYNESLFKSVSIPEVLLVHSDFLQVSTSWKYDFIVGNPPYFVTTQTNPECMVGRPNMYVLFLYKCLKEHLVPNGYLAFVLPTSLFNCSYYEPMRKYIANHCTIHYIEKLDVKYYQTQQDTMLILLQNKPDPTEKYLIKRNGCVYISPFYESIQKDLIGSSSLHDLGYEVKTGDVVWNQVRDGKNPSKLQKNGKPYPDIGELVDSGGVLLIYDSNIVNGSLILNNLQDPEKKQYIKQFNKKEREEYVDEKGNTKSRLVQKTPIQSPAILVSRGHGNTYHFNFVLVKDKEFYAENHVNMILPRTEEAKMKIEAVAKSLTDSRTSRFIEQFIGNGAMSATELQYILPIFLA